MKPNKYKKFEGVLCKSIANGIMVSKALEAADKLQAEGINTTVVNFSTIKPIEQFLNRQVSFAH